MSMPAAITSLTSMAMGALVPFAVVSDVIVAGVFSLVNTLLSAATIWFLNRSLRGVPEKVDEAHKILETQQSHMSKRVTDEPDVTE